MKKQSYKIVVQRVSYTKLSDLLSSASNPLHIEPLKVSVYKGKNLLKCYYVKEYPFSCPLEFDAFLGRLFRASIVDIEFISGVSVFYVTSYPHFENEVKEFPLQISSDKFFLLFSGDFFGVCC